MLTSLEDLRPLKSAIADLERRCAAPNHWDERARNYLLQLTQVVDYLETLINTRREQDGNT